MNLEGSGSKSGLRDMSVLNWKSLGKKRFKGASEVDKEGHKAAAEKMVVALRRRGRRG